jgi:trehalose 6-phosphate phosphatase
MIQAVADAILALAKPALCLDFDGTLVEIAPRPEAIKVAPQLPGLLAALHDRFDGRVAIITGRTYADLSRYLDVTAFAVASSHGAEFSTPQSAEVQTLIEAADLDPLRPVLAEAISGLPGVFLEDKGTAIALHTRPNPRVHQGLFDHLRDLTTGHDNIHVASGKGIVEVRLTGEDKGRAVTRLIGLPGWEGAQPVMVGDDTTDNDGMSAARDHGGFGIQVGEGPDGTGLANATLKLDSVRQTHAMLNLLTR